MDPFVPLVFVLGAAIGSFLNVFIYRYNTNLSLGGRSMCLYCGKELRWYELVPLLSYLYLRGRCASCKSRLSLQYPLVELSTALLFLGVYHFTAARFAGGEFIGASLLFAAAGSLIVAIAAYDMRHLIIPDELAFFLALLGLARIALFLLPGETAATALAAGPLIAAPLALLHFLSGGRMMGLGDAKLAVGLGWLLGLAGSIETFIFSFWVGGAVAVLLLFLRYRHVTMKSEIPFAPFLAAAFGLSLFIPPEVLLTLIFSLS